MFLNQDIRKVVAGVWRNTRGTSTHVTGEVTACLPEMGSQNSPPLIGLQIP